MGTVCHLINSTNLERRRLHTSDNPALYSNGLIDNMIKPIVILTAIWIYLTGFHLNYRDKTKDKTLTAKEFSWCA